MTATYATTDNAVSVAADDIISGALDLLANPDNWLPNADAPHYNAPIAVDAGGGACDADSPYAVRWTINGALTRASVPVCAAIYDVRDAMDARYLARGRVNDAANRFRPQAAGRIWMDDWQRNADHAAVIALLDRARGGPSLPTGTAFIGNGGRPPERSAIAPPSISLRGRRR